MLIFKTKDFARLARKERLSDGDLVDAVARAERGQIDARIGRHLMKQRLARPGAGRSGGLRTIVFYIEGRRAVFLYLFPKSRKANLTPNEEEAYRHFAVDLARLTEAQLRQLVTTRGWMEIDHDETGRGLSE